MKRLLDDIVVTSHETVDAPGPASISCNYKQQQPQQQRIALLQLLY